MNEDFRRRLALLLSVGASYELITDEINPFASSYEWAAAIFGLGLLFAALILPTDGAARARTAHDEAHADLALSLDGV